MELISVLLVVLLIAVIHLWTEVKAMQKSTHSIQYMPLDTKQQNFEKVTDELKEKLTEDPFGNL